MKLSMNNGVLTVTGEGKTIEVDIVDGELEVFGDFVVEEESEEETDL